MPEKLPTKLVGIQIRDQKEIKLFRYGKNPILRGTALIEHERLAHLWTRGYVPRLETYPGREVPNPLTIDIRRGDADIEQVLENLDIVVHASTISEPFGQVVVQGMAAGKPVVATAGGGVREIVENNVNGLLVQKNDSRAMSDAILQLLADPEKARCIGLEAQRTVARKFTIERTARAAEALFLDVLKATRQRRR